MITAGTAGIFPRGSLLKHRYCTLKVLGKPKGLPSKTTLGINTALWHGHLGIHRRNLETLCSNPTKALQILIPALEINHFGSPISPQSSSLLGFWSLGAHFCPPKITGWLKHLLKSQFGGWNQLYFFLLVWALFSQCLYTVWSPPSSDGLSGALCNLVIAFGQKVVKGVALWCWWWGHKREDQWKISWDAKHIYVYIYIKTGSGILTAWTS